MFNVLKKYFALKPETIVETGVRTAYISRLKI